MGNEMGTIVDVLNNWYTRVDAAQKAHYSSSNTYRSFSLLLGVPTVILSLFVGTSVFASLQTKPSVTLQAIVGSCSVLAAVLAGLQTFFGFAERSERHRLAAAKYGAIGRELEILRSSSGSIDQKTIDRLREKIDSLGLESPVNADRIYRKATMSSTKP
jgi:hypothetical protein